MNETLGLFVADLNRSINGLSQSLRLGSPASLQAAVHARDLSDALHGVDLPGHAEVAFSLSKQLAASNPGAADTANEFVALVKEVLEDLLSSKPIDHEAQREKLDPVAKALSVFEEKPIDLDSLAHLAPYVPPTPMAKPEPANLRAQNEGPEHEGPEPVTLHLQSSEAGSAPAPRQFSGGGLREGLVRVRALQELVAGTVSAEVAKKLEFSFSDCANWMAAQASQDLTRLLRSRTDQLSGEGIQTDLTVFSVLQEILGRLGFAQSMRCSVRQMTVFVEANDVRLRQDDLAWADDRISQIHGRIDAGDGSYQMIFPLTVNRLRTVSFVRHGRLFAASWAQFLGAQACEKTDEIFTDALGSLTAPRASLQFKANQKTFSLYAHDMRPFDMATLFETPNDLGLPSFVGGLAVGSSADPMAFLSLGHL